MQIAQRNGLQHKEYYGVEDGYQQNKPTQILCLQAMQRQRSVVGRVLMANGGAKQSRTQKSYSRGSNDIQSASARKQVDGKSHQHREQHHPDMFHIEWQDDDECRIDEGVEIYAEVDVVDQKDLQQHQHHKGYGI